MKNFFIIEFTISVLLLLCVISIIRSSDKNRPPRINVTRQESQHYIISYPRTATGIARLEDLPPVPELDDSPISDIIPGELFPSPAPVSATKNPIEDIFSKLQRIGKSPETATSPDGIFWDQPSPPEKKIPTKSPSLRRTDRQSPKSFSVSSQVPVHPQPPVLPPKRKCCELIIKKNCICQ